MEKTSQTKNPKNIENNIIIVKNYIKYDTKWWFKVMISIIELLEQINKVDGIERIRLGSIETKANNRRIRIKIIWN